MTGASNPEAVWKRPALAEPNHVEMGGVLGDAFSRGLKRIGIDPPYTVQYLLADLNFDMQRFGANFSGDVSGRFLELASLTSSPQNPAPPTLPEVMSKIPMLQQLDGHFGAAIDWQEPIDFDSPLLEAKMMPTMWGNGRILLGLVACHARFGDPDLLDSALKLGDFYVNVAADRFCDPNCLAEYQKSPGYAGAYVTCVFHGIAGLVQLYNATDDARYLDVAQRMADFHSAFDTLPVEHAHGSISAHEALLMLYEATGDPRYLKRVTDRWTRAVTGGYVTLAGGVLEKFVVAGFNRDEGCAESDWLRVNLMLWRELGDTRYLDMAERLLWNEYLANQWPDGGYGHRLISTDAQGAYAYGRLDEEAVWCCCFHGPLGLRALKSYLAVGGAREIYLNFPTDFTAPVTVGRDSFTVASKTLPADENIPVKTEVTLAGAGQAPLMVRIPDWADEVIIQSGAKRIPALPVNGYLRTPPVASGDKLEIAYHARPHLETRLGQRIPIPAGLPADLKDVVIRQGPEIFLNAGSGDIQNVTLNVKGQTEIEIPKEASAKMAPWLKLQDHHVPHAFVFNVRLEGAAAASER